MKWDKIRRLLPAAVTLLWLGVIWGRSLQPAALSNQESGAVLSGLLELFHALGLPPFLNMTLVRKAAHMAEYAVLAVLLFWSCASAGGGMLRRLGLVYGLALTCALTDETIQLFVPGRSGQVSDIWVDLAGALLGTLAALLLSALRRWGGGKKAERRPPVT